MVVAVFPFLISLYSFTIIYYIYAYSQRQLRSLFCERFRSIDSFFPPHHLSSIFDTGLIHSSIDVALHTRRFHFYFRLTLSREPHCFSFLMWSLVDQEAKRTDFIGSFSKYTDIWRNDDFLDGGSSGNVHSGNVQVQSVLLTKRRGPSFSERVGSTWT